MRASNSMRAACAALLTASLAPCQLQVPAQYPTIQAAVNAAVSGNTIQVSGGTYVLALPINPQGKDVVIEAVGTVVLDGNFSTRHFMFSSAETSAMVVRGFTLINGRAPDGSAGSQGQGGGSVRIVNASPTFEDCEFTNNRAGDGGAGNSSQPTGGTGGFGGAVLAQASASRFERCYFFGNRSGVGGVGAPGQSGSSGVFGSPAGGAGSAGSSGGAGGDGAAIAASGAGNVTLFNCGFRNHEVGRGGAGGAGGAGGNGLLFGGSYVGPGGAGGSGGAGGLPGKGITSGNIHYRNCSFRDNRPTAGAAGGSGGSGGAGVPTGPTGASGSTGSPALLTGVHGVVFGNYNADVRNCAFWNVSTLGGQSVPTQDLGGPMLLGNCATPQPIGGWGCILLTSEPFDGGMTPYADSPLLDAADESWLPASITQDLRRGIRRFDLASQPGVLDIGAVERTRGEWFETGCGSNPSNTLIENTPYPRIAQSIVLSVHAPVAHFTNPSFAVLAASTQQPSSGCGPIIPGFGMVPTSQGGELLVPQPVLLPVALWNGTPTPYSIPVPNTFSLIGARLAFQGAMVDSADGRIGLTRGLVAVIGNN